MKPLDKLQPSFAICFDFVNPDKIKSNFGICFDREAFR